MLDDLDAMSVIFALVFFVFREITINCLAASNEPPGDTCHRTHLWVFLYEPPSGVVCTAKRCKLVCPVVLVLFVL